MAELVVKKTTACKRCGAEGLAWVQRRDGSGWYLSPAELNELGQLVVETSKFHKCTSPLRGGHPHSPPVRPVVDSEVHGLSLRYIETAQAEEEEKDLLRVIDDLHRVKLEINGKIDGILLKLRRLV